MFAVATSLLTCIASVPARSGTRSWGQTAPVSPLWDAVPRCNDHRSRCQLEVLLLRSARCCNMNWHRRRHHWTRHWRCYSLTAVGCHGIAAVCHDCSRHPWWIHCTVRSVGMSSCNVPRRGRVSWCCRTNNSPEYRTESCARTTTRAIMIIWPCGRFCHPLPPPPLHSHTTYRTFIYSLWPSNAATNTIAKIGNTLAASNISMLCMIRQFLCLLRLVTLCVSLNSIN